MVINFPFQLHTASNSDAASNFLGPGRGNRQETLIGNVSMQVLSSGLGLDPGQVRGVRRAAEGAVKGAATGRYLVRGRNQRRTRKTRRRTRTGLTRGRRTTVGSVTLTPLSLTKKVNPAVRK